MTHWMFKTFKHCFFIYCLIYLTQADVPVVKEEYCTKYSSNPDSTTNIFVNGTVSRQNRNECVRYYRIDIPFKQPGERYFLFEVEFDYLPSNKSLMPLLLGYNKTKPSMDETGWINDDVAFDTNGYLNRKTYYNILMDLQSLPPPLTLYFALYQYNNDTVNYKTETLTYKVQTTLSKNYLCPQDCMRNKGMNTGVCDQTLKQCVCKRGFFDLDCSESAPEIAFEGSPLSQSLPSQSWTYFFIDSKDYGGNLKFSIKKQPGTVYLTFLFQDTYDFMIPNFDPDTYDGRFLLTSDNNDQNLKLPESGFKTHIGGRLMIGAYNVENEPVNVEFSVGLFDKEESSRSAIMFVMIGIASGLVILWIIFSILKYRAYRHAALVRRQQQLALLRSRLSKEEIDKYFPLKNFDQLKSSFPQTMCSICLDDFIPEVNCRQLYCEHIYHGPCIQEWFANHPSCPFCKKDMTRTAIEEHLKNPNGPSTTSPQPVSADGTIISSSQSPEKDHLVSGNPSELVKVGSMKEINMEPPNSKRKNKIEGERTRTLSTEQVIVQNSSSLKSIPIDLKVEVGKEVGEDREKSLGGS